MMSLNKESKRLRMYLGLKGYAEIVEIMRSPDIVDKFPDCRFFSIATAFT